MKRILALMAMSAACGLAGCASDGSWNFASNDNQMGWHDRNDVTATGDMNRRDLHAAYGITDNDKNMTAMNGTGTSGPSVTGATVGGSATYSGSTYNSANAGMTSSPAVSNPNDPQLRHGNDKTDISVALNDVDRAFLQEAASGGMYEVQSSQKALAKSADGRVKMIAQHMIDDHTKANSQLAALAQRKGVEVSTLPTTQQTAMLARLDQLNGAEFDREYVSQQRTAHQDTIAKFQTASTSGKDRDVRDFAAQTLPILRSHLSMINNENSTNVGTEK
jgi:putative membrane protein